MLSWFERLIRRPEPLCPSGSAAAVPPGGLPSYAFTDPRVRIMAIGDLHGRLDLLERLAPVLDAAARDPARRSIEVYLGDYVDRGADPRAVVDHLVGRMTLSDREVVCLAGNHEQMLLGALETDADFLRWLEFGGRSTLRSYGIDPDRAAADPTGTRFAFAEALPASHVAFMRSLPLSYAHGGFFFAHAGVRPGVALEAQTSRDLLWIRKPFLDSSDELGAVVVHGHTPGRAPEFRRNRIGIDTGAYRTGILTCLLVTSDIVLPIDSVRAGWLQAGSGSAAATPRP